MPAMSTLREQLDQARQAYAARRYPGDLAGELPPRRLGPRSRIFIAISAAASIAAAAAIAVILSNPFGRPSSDTLPLGQPVVQAMDMQLPPMPDLPTGMSIVPDYQAITLPGMPSFPSMDAGASQEDTPTTQEPV